MIRRIAVPLLLSAFLLNVSLAQAQQQAKIIKSGWLASGPVRSARFESYKQALHTLGYVEGKNIFIEYRSAEGKLDRLPALVEELVRLKVDLIVANSTSAALTAKKVTKTIPIVFNPKPTIILAFKQPISVCPQWIRSVFAPVEPLRSAAPSNLEVSRCVRVDESA